MVDGLMDMRVRWKWKHELVKALIASFLMSTIKQNGLNCGTTAQFNGRRRTRHQYKGDTRVLRSVKA